MVLVTVSTPVKPTEDPEQVRAALVRLFPDLELVSDGAGLHGTTTDLRSFRRRVWELRIIDTVRGQILHGAPAMTAKATTFRLSKQAAHAGKVSFPPTPHALGDLEVRVEVGADDPFKDVEGFAYWLCPETKDGEIVGKVD